MALTRQQQVHTAANVRMAPKRKATTAANGRSSKRVASGVSTPVSMGPSDDEYSDSGDIEEIEPADDHLAGQ